MRTAIVVLLFAIPAGAQWRKFGETPAIGRKMLDAHNAVRARVGVPPLVWSPELAKVAQDWADTLLAKNQFAHRPKTEYGENLFAVSGARATPESAFAAWAEEEPNYRHANNSCRGVCGHYTQIVWASTRKLGCAVARGPRREVWVCNYDPAGNYVGQPPY